jgi:DNA-binding MarR family transcriptional regulator
MESAWHQQASTDIVLLLEACTARLDDDVLARVRSELGDDVRFRDGYVFQHLIDEPQSISELARRLGVTQQAASKQVADLVGRRLVTKDRDPTDARSWLVSLTDRGHRVVESGRRARSAVADDLVSELGAPSFRTLVEHLVLLSDRTDAFRHMMDRRLRPDDSR